MSIDQLSFSQVNNQQITENKIVTPQKDKKISIFEVSDTELEQDFLQIQPSETKQKNYKTVIKKTKEHKPIHLHFSTKKTALTQIKPQTSIPKIISPPSLLRRFKGTDLTELRFSQKTINHQLSNNGSFLFKNPILGAKDPTFFQMLQKEGWKSQYKIDVVLMPDNCYTSLDNRRLAVAKAINSLFPNTICVYAAPHYHSDKANSALMTRVCPPGSPSPSPTTENIEKNSYGHAILIRVQETKGAPSDSTYGFHEYPLVITGLKGKGKKKIILGTSGVKLEA